MPVHFTDETQNYDDISSSVIQSYTICTCLCTYITLHGLAKTRHRIHKRQWKLTQNSRKQECSLQIQATSCKRNIAPPTILDITLSRTTQLSIWSLLDVS